jgi:putative addiction module killer protein
MPLFETCEPELQLPVIDRAATGNLGDAKSVGDGVSELRVDVGAGYRVYFTKRNGAIIVLLAGGDKSTQVQTYNAQKKWQRRFNHEPDFDNVRHGGTAG